MTDGLSNEERAAVKARAKELRDADRGKDKDEAALLKAIAEMDEPDRALAQRIHAVVTAAAPELVAKTWYGQPAYARPGKGGKVVVFFRSGLKDKERYSSLGFSAEANLDEGGFWPTSYAVTDLDEAAEAALFQLVKRAVS
ncbi:hypothetical protein [Glycomyces algeriensis]|uniref:YdhG-like domain-containing protein n=1 Tax=Glycomyces algeriensis TaxID=256037 RepID=A0A9W6GBH1_9ACTN|nr:hypothetical protein [Glycomyces algeriensis]MDA1367385.1 hypothetical protein [Glycomyces algeriensis]MDR7350961.1 uncharacterized protein YdhG (YjbR/CyaY superfamily) [Glycomyces algeriensis]GLI43673.1 hypothetical protein GALLR39Z86_35230 [Glycomyces algeriensis]